MSENLDLVLDRRRLRRRVRFWRVVAALAVIVTATVAIRSSGAFSGGPHVTRVSIDGLITDEPKLLSAIRAAGKDKEVRALIISINSPGGTVAGGEALYRAFTAAAANKPVVAVMRGLAASAGYMIAMPANRVFARESTLTGSIGVLMETGEVSGLLGKLGVTTEALTSGPLKDQPSFTRPITPEGRAVLHGLVMDMYDQFVGMVATGRHMVPDKVRALADGRAYTGRQALKLGLIDAIGGEAEARDWLASEKGVSADLPVEDLSVGTLTERLLSSELSPMLGRMWKSVISQSVMLDGPMALWHQ
jgi:protease-4